MTEAITEGEATAYRATVIDVMEAMGANLLDVVSVSKSTGISMDDMCSTAFGAIGAEQLRAMCETLRRSPDELIAIAEAPKAEIDRRKGITRAQDDLHDAAMALEYRARGAAHLLRRLCDGDGMRKEHIASIELVADSLDEAAEGVAQALVTLTKRMSM